MHSTIKLTALAAALTVALQSTTAVAAEGSVPEAINRVNATLNALIATVNQLATSVNQLIAASASSATSSILVSPPVLGRGGAEIGCYVTNAGTATANVKFSLINAYSGTTLFTGSTALAPGLGTGNLALFGPTTQHLVYCKIEGDVPPAKLRANLVAYDGGVASAVAEAK